MNIKKAFHSIIGELTWKDILLIMALGALNFLVVKASLWLLSGRAGLAPFWPANGFLLAVILLSKKSWFGPLLVVSMTAILVGNLFHGWSFGASFGLAIANIIEIGIATFVVRLLPSKVQFIKSLRETMVFLGVATFLCSALSGIIAGFFLWHFSGADFFNTWRNWWLADAVGMAITTPFVLSWFGAKKFRLDFENALRMFEFGIVLLLLTGIAYLVFSDTIVEQQILSHLKPYMALPLLVWSALRFGTRGASLSLIILALISIWFTWSGHGPFISGGHVDNASLLLTHAYNYSAIFCSLVPAAILAEQKSIKSQLRRSVERFENLYSGNMLGVHFVNQDGIIDEANQSFLDLIGYSKQELDAGKIRFNSLVVPEAETEKGLEKFSGILSGNLVSVERIFIRKDGSKIHVFHSETSVENQGHKMGVVYNITELKEMVHAYLIGKDVAIAEKSLAETANKAKTHFLTTMSHEIRTPLSGILGLNALLLESGLSAEQEKIVKMAMAGGEHLLSVINQVLDISKIESGKVDLNFVTFRMHDLLEGSKSFILELARKKDLEIILTIDPKANRIFYGDLLRIRQVLINLLGNAVKFSSQGYIFLSVEIIALDDNKAEVLFQVLDQGAGIPVAMQKKIFEPFKQGASAQSNRIEGTGLGLGICKDLMSLMQGKIWVESEEGHGSCFYVSLPLNLGLEVVKPSPEKLPELPAEGQIDAIAKDVYGGHYSPKILVADDHPVNGLIASSLLKSLGCQVTVALDGVAALDMVKVDSFDLVFMDCEMPEMNGYEATQKIRKEQNYDFRIPIIGLTADALGGTYNNCIEAGMDDVLTKPFSRQSLDGILNKWLSEENRKGNKSNLAISWATIDDLATGPDGPEGLHRIYSLFKQTSHQSIESVRRQWAHGEYQALPRTLHHFKGSCSILGFPKLATIAGQMEESVRAGNYSNLGPQISRLKLAFEEVDSQMTRKFVQKLIT